jgi:hypothetical protein
LTPSSALQLVGSLFSLRKTNACRQSALDVIQLHLWEAT